jgi:pilus assembly protein CpaF
MGRFSLRRAVTPDAGPIPAPPSPTTAPVVVVPTPEPVVAPTQAQDDMLDMRLRLHGKLIEEIDLSKLGELDEGEMRRQVRRLATTAGARLIFGSGKPDTASSAGFLGR